MFSIVFKTTKIPSTYAKKKRKNKMEKSPCPINTPNMIKLLDYIILLPNTTVQSDLLRFLLYKRGK